MEIVRFVIGFAAGNVLSIANIKPRWGKDIEAIRVLKEDFVKRGLDENLILEVGEDFVILSSEVKIRIAAQITLGLVTEPVSLDGCESHVKEFTEI